MQKGFFGLLIVVMHHGGFVEILSKCQGLAALSGSVWVYGGCTIRGFWKAAEVHLKGFFRSQTVADLLSLCIDDVDAVFSGVQSTESFSQLSKNGREMQKSRCITPGMVKRATRKGD